MIGKPTAPARQLKHAGKEGFLTRAPIRTGYCRRREGAPPTSIPARQPAPPHVEAPLSPLAVRTPRRHEAPPRQGEVPASPRPNPYPLPLPQAEPPPERTVRPQPRPPASSEQTPPCSALTIPRAPAATRTATPPEPRPPTPTAPSEHPRQAAAPPRAGERGVRRLGDCEVNRTLRRKCARGRGRTRAMLRWGPCGRVGHGAPARRRQRCMSDSRRCGVACLCDTPDDTRASRLRGSRRHPRVPCPSAVAHDGRPLR